VAQLEKKTRALRIDLMGIGAPPQCEMSRPAGGGSIAKNACWS